MASPIHTGSRRSSVDRRPVVSSWWAEVGVVVLTERCLPGEGPMECPPGARAFHRGLSIWRERGICIVVCQYGHPSIHQTGGPA
ncbi:hypothetical protein GCM10009867_23480 [Pedococcus aerophilus]|uniref:Uncharacterized protein n=1 Tax=Pedococcus aerophilus TaxID=436356 RepID=A0ABN3UQ99_9MICO